VIPDSIIEAEHTAERTKIGQKVGEKKRKSTQKTAGKRRRRSSSRFPERRNKNNAGWKKGTHRLGDGKKGG